MFIANFTLKTFVQNILFNFREILDFSNLHPVREMKKNALQETVSYIQKKMLHALALNTVRQLLEEAIKEAPKGHFCEFGVYKGGSIQFIAKKSRSTIIHGFDSFKGLPEHWNSGAANANKGCFSTQGKLPKVAKNVKLHKGLFHETLPKWLNTFSGPIAFIHIDCDLYSSTKTVLSLLQPRIHPGTIIVFDEYFNYPNWQHHEFKAFQEFIEESGVSYDYLFYSARQVAIKITGVKGPLKSNNDLNDLDHCPKTPCLQEI